jgi:hypothetical protein
MSEAGGCTTVHTAIHFMLWTATGKTVVFTLVLAVIGDLKFSVTARLNL